MVQLAEELFLPLQFRIPWLGRLCGLYCISDHETEQEQMGGHTRSIILFTILVIPTSKGMNMSCFDTGLTSPFGSSLLR